MPRKNRNKYFYVEQNLMRINVYVVSVFWVNSAVDSIFSWYKVKLTQEQTMHE